MGENVLIVKLPFPDAVLFPNRKNGKHWTATTVAKEAQKAAGFYMTMKALTSSGPQEWPEHIPLSLMYVTPDKRNRDADNMLAASKALLDGMADALGVNDRRFKPVLIDWVHGDKEGALIVAVGVSIVSGLALNVE